MSEPVHFPGGVVASKPTLTAREFYYATDTGVLYLGNPGGTEFEIHLDADYVRKDLFDANTILAANTDNTPAALAVAENSILGRVAGNIDDIAVAASRIVGRTAAGNLAALTTAEVATLLGYQTVRSPIERFIAGNLYVANDPSTMAWYQIIYFATACTISRIYAGVATAPTGADLIMDAYWSATDPNTAATIWGVNAANKTTIAANARESTQTGDAGVPDTTAMTAGSFLVICIEQVGSTVAGADLAYTITFA